MKIRGSGQPVDGALVKLISDAAYPEVNVRYFMADVALGGSLEFYRKAAEEAHEMGCLEAVRRIENGFTITNLDEFERKRVEGKVLITRKGSEERISGTEVKLSSDPTPNPKLPTPNDPMLHRSLFILLAAPSAMFAADLSGTKLLVTSVRTGDTDVFIADPVTGDMFNVTRSPESEDRYPCWSPDARNIVFMREQDGRKNLWICAADGTGVRRLIDTPAVTYMPSWQMTPEGERIVFGMHGEKPEMASIRPDGTDLKMLGEGHDPTLSPDGKFICYTGHPPEGGVTVYVMDWDGGNKRRVVPETSKVGATFPNWSPDGKQIVYSFPVGDALELFVINVDGTNERQLTKFGGGTICTPAAWSPDGKWISFRQTDERYWSNPERMKLIYDTKPADKRPVWVIRPSGEDATLIEPLHYQMAIDGSRASWKPVAR